MEIARHGPTIEHARSEDGPAIVALLTANGLPVEGALDHLKTAVVARAGDQVVGSAVLEIYADGALLRSVAVEASLRGIGVGQRLTEAALALASAHRVPGVYLLTTTAEGFFPRFAFQTITRDQVPAGVQASVEFRSACPASAIVMRRLCATPK